MKCSECSRKLKPIVAIDIDGTLGDYHRHFIDFAEEYLDKNLPQAFDGTKEMHEELGISLELYREVKLAYRQGGGKRSMPVFPGARELIRSCKSMDVEVWITTTRPYLRLDSTDPDTRFWLDRHGIMYDSLLYDEDKYQKLGEYVERSRVIMILDDLVKQYDHAEAIFGEDVPVLRSSFWNRGTSRKNMVKDLHQARHMVVARAEKWYADINVGV